MTDLYDIPKAERTREVIRAHYYQVFPMLKVFDEIIDERNSVPNPDINDPADPPNAVSTLAATEMTLIRVGKPPRDRDDVLHAERYLREVRREMEAEFPPLADHSPLVELVIDGLYGLAGCVPSAESWDGFDTETQEFELDEIMAFAPDHTNALKALLREALKYGMPGVLREITARYGGSQHPSLPLGDATTRMPTAVAQALHEATEGAPTTGPEGEEKRYSIAEWTALLMAAATGAPTLDEAIEHLEREADRG